MSAGFISDQRMLDLIEILKAENKIRFTQEFCDAIGFRKQNIRNVKNGAQHFTPEHIRMACLVFHCDANWIFNLQNPKGHWKIEKNTVTKKVTKISRKWSLFE